MKSATVAFYGAITLDGFLADEKDQLQWLFETEQNGVDTYTDFIKEVESVVMGRVTYQETKKILAGAPLNSGKQNYVFSKTISELADARIVAENPVTFIGKLKETTDKTIWIVGGGDLVTTLLAADLIDEWWIQIAPVLLGKGKRLFVEGDYFRRLELVDTTVMGQFMELHYRRVK